MLEVNERIRIPDDEFTWSFVRSGGPGGQNVNKVASKAVLRWDLAASPSVPDDVKARLRTQQRRRITADGELVLNSQRYRDQERNRLDCLDKVRDMLGAGSHTSEATQADAADARIAGGAAEGEAASGRPQDGKAAAG